jgi:hypothetical protein
MAKIDMELSVAAIHGEGDRDTVNTLQKHRNDTERIRQAQAGNKTPDMPPSDEPPDVTIVLRGDSHHLRMEIPVTDWDTVEQWKKLAGWDADKRHWQHGAKVKVTISAG